MSVTGIKKRNMEIKQGRGMQATRVSKLKTPLKQMLLFPELEDLFAAFGYWDKPPRKKRRRKML